MRNVVENIEVDGVQLKKGDRALLMYGCANRDEAKYPNARVFDFTRNPMDNVSFGYGLHHCAGQGLARLEGRSILSAMLRHFDDLEIGEAKRHYNNAVRGLGSLPTKVTPAAGA